jgi:hypothetical protein
VTRDGVTPNSGLPVGEEMVEDRLQIIRERMWRILGRRGEARSIEFQDSASQLRENEQSGPARSAGDSTEKDSSTPWILEEWRRISIPEWQRILKEAESAGDTQRAKYARWMLSEVLEAGTNPGTSE